MEVKIKNKGQAQLFGRNELEALTKTSPRVIFSIYIPIILGLIAYSVFGFHKSGWHVFAYFVAGAFFWTFFEYIMHRFVFHMHSEKEKVKKVIYAAHGVHHEYPRDKDRLFMPPIPSLFLATLLFSIFFLFLRENALLFFPGFVSGYLAYGSIHYAIHAMAPPFKFMKPLWRYHHLHHYKSPEHGFGVSSAFWDHVFGTIPQHEGKFDNPEER